MFSSFGDMLSFTLTAFVELMDHGIVSWDTFSVAFIKKVIQIVLPKLKPLLFLQIFFYALSLSQSCFLLFFVLKGECYF